MSIPCVFAAGHFYGGFEGANEVTDLPSGFTYKMYNQIYYSDVFKDKNGNSIGSKFDTLSYRETNRLFYVSDFKILGAKYAASLSLPIVYNDVNLLGANQNRFNIGDIFVEPFMLLWNTPQFDAFASLGLFAPTGEFDPNNAASTGTGAWGGMFSAGATYYFDVAREWFATATARYEMDSDRRDIDLRDGDMMYFDYGFGKVFPFGDGCRNKFLVGANGYSVIQVTDSVGKASTDLREQNFGAGPSLGVYLADYKLTVNAKTFFEFGAANHSEGYLTMLSVTKSF